MVSDWPPAPPEGYRLDDPEYKQPWYVTALLYVWIIGVLVGVPALVISVQSLDTTGAIVREVLQPNGTSKWPVYLGWTAATLAVLFGSHEAVHALCGRWVGLRTKFRFQYNTLFSWSPEVVTYGGFQSHGESLAIALTPLVVLTPVSTVVLVVGQHLWLIRRRFSRSETPQVRLAISRQRVLWRLPDGELLYHDSDGRRQYYTPVNR